MTFKVEVDVTCSAIVPLLNRLVQIGEQILAKEIRIMAKIDDVIQAIADETTVEASVVTLLDQLSAQLAAAGTDPAKLQSVLDQLAKNKQNLADAITRNTPAAPTA